MLKIINQKVLLTIGIKMFFKIFIKIYYYNIKLIKVIINCYDTNY